MNDKYIPGCSIHPFPLHRSEILAQLHEAGFSSWKDDGERIGGAGYATVYWKPSVQLFVCDGTSPEPVGVGATPVAAVTAYKAKLRAEGARMLADAEAL